MSKLYLVFPHQLFRSPPIPEGVRRVAILEEPLFFSQYRFHRAKLVYHRATMKWYQGFLEEAGYEVTYWEHRELEEWEVSRKLLPEGSEVCLVDPTDDWLSQKVRRAAVNSSGRVHWIESPAFLLSREEREAEGAGRERLFMADFYRRLRQRRMILMSGDEPVGGSYSFDGENRKKLPEGHEPPAVPDYLGNDQIEEAEQYVADRFPDAPGEWNPIFPATFEEAEAALDRFLEDRLELFGTYQDAVQPGEPLLYHSLLSPALNVGLLTPKRVLDRTLAFAEGRELRINSLEGFVRQLIGWREFMLISYQKLGRRMRSRNFFRFDRPMPEAFYTGDTGLEPVDEVIERVLRFGYAHHIERLMFLGNPMLLCDIAPEAVYRWFMELFIDAYDWVMVPNVYGMSQYADGGLITTKPYVSSSNYIRKMSPYGRGNWADVWDGLFWRFVEKHYALFEKNPRMKMMARQLDKMDPEKRDRHRRVAEGYLHALHESGEPARFVAELE